MLYRIQNTEWFISEQGENPYVMCVDDCRNELGTLLDKNEEKCERFQKHGNGNLL